MRTFLLVLMVFAATFALDYVWTRYIAEVGNKRAHLAAVWSTLMIPLSAVNVLGYTTHWWLIFPAMVGAYASTWYAVWRDSRRKNMADYIELFAAANLHWSKDPATPYDGCRCSVCAQRRADRCTYCGDSDGGCVICNGY
jgi:hypothetical protein